MPKVLRGPLLAVLGLTLGLVPGGDATAPSSGVDTARIPADARRYLPLVTDLTARQCPELPPLWVVAQVEAESGWDPAATGDGVGGLLQFDQLTWMAAGGAPWSARTRSAATPYSTPELTYGSRCPGCAARCGPSRAT